MIDISRSQSCTHSARSRVRIVVSSSGGSQVLATVHRHTLGPVMGRKLLCFSEKKMSVQEFKERIDCLLF